MSSRALSDVLANGRHAGFALALAVLSAAPAPAVICAPDNVPAATLLVPFFAVDLSRPDGRTTLFSINNAGAAPALAHVTVWTDWGVPTLSFDVYLTGYDVQTLNVRDILAGGLPRTAPLGQDPHDTISHKGPLSQDAAFPDCAGLPPGIPALDAARVASLRLAHTGKNAPFYGGCLGADYADTIARGYITIDAVTRCSALDPTSPGYFDTVASTDNVLWGKSVDVNPFEKFAHAEALVHIEACPRTGGTGRCPFAPGKYTFYGRFRAVSGDDRREPLPTTFATSFLNGGAFSGGTSLVVWRDAKRPAGAATHARPCGTPPTWLPLVEADVVAFDEQENVADICFMGDNTIPIYPPISCFPMQTQEVSLSRPNVFGDTPQPPYDFGWMFLNLNHSQWVDDPFPHVAQAWVQTVSSASGLYSVGYNATGLDSACDTTGVGVVLIP